MTTTEPVGAAPPRTPAPGTRPAWRRPPIFPILLLWAGFTVLLLLFALFVPARVMGPPASPTMREIESTVTWFSVASAPVAAMVWADPDLQPLVWRHRGKDAPAETAPPIRGNRRVQATWLVTSTALCLFLLIWGLVVLAPPASEASATTPPLVVNVTGQQWAWTFDYPGSGGPGVGRAVPPGQPARRCSGSRPRTSSTPSGSSEMGVKVDANPGETTTATVTPDQLGTFTIRCAELCGLYHSYMQTTVHVVSQADFAAVAADRAAGDLMSAAARALRRPARKGTPWPR